MPLVAPLGSALFTDLYELTMGEAYLAEGMRDDASFELVFRRLPTTRRFVVAAGLEDVLDALEGVSRAIDLIRSSGSSLSVRAVRLDSGDLAELARASRRMLDEAGLEEIKIFASSCCAP